ncbi:MAG: hypothetical protein B7Z78_08185 [Rhodospirillales bacterium 20-60-12]|nr:MAG: hypothetical protein B7Z78_08185 [Rhodospirillales bacterium 20-60-12]
MSVSGFLPPSPMSHSGYVSGGAGAVMKKSDVRLLAGLIIAAWAVLPSGAACAAGPDQPPAFSAGSLAGWTAKTFSGKAKTSYQLVQQEGSTVLHATCADSASGLVWQNPIDLRKTPIMSWRWKIGGVFAGLDPHAKSGDDYPVRVYVVTGDMLFPWTVRSLVYVWANGPVNAALHGPHGTPFYPDPYTSQAEIVALRQGPAGAGSWMPEQRNVRADLARAFGGHPKIINAVAVMSDCDDSHSSGQAWYGDITFQPAG